MLTIYDFLMIGFYLIFMLGIGFLWKRLNKNSSDYFRGGGSMLWWMTGVSALAAGLSAYTFTAASAFVLDTGFLLIVVYLSGVSTLTVIYFFFAKRFRQMRVVTSCDAIRRRYGVGTEQFWVWIVLPLSVFGGGVSLYIVSIFISSALQFDIYTTMILLGVIVTIMAATGGTWAVVASDFIQMLIIVIVSVTVFIRCFMLPDIGGVSGFLEKIPTRYTNFSEFEDSTICLLWLGMFLFMNFFNSANIDAHAGKYLAVKDGKQAKQSTLILIVGAIIIPFIAFLPVMFVPILNLDIKSMFPNLTNPSEGAYLAIAREVLPTGMLGLLVCAIFAATMSSMDTAVNKTAGFFVKNFLAEFVLKNASETKLLYIGKLFSFIFGAMVIVVAILFHNFREGDLFSYMLRLNVLIGYPMVIPAVWGILYRKTPGWSAWSTVLVGMVVAWYTQNCIDYNAVAKFLGLERAANAMEKEHMLFFTSGFITLFAGSAWYFFTSIFYKNTKVEFKESVDIFFKDMATPIDHEVEGTDDNDSVQYKFMGILSMIYGVSVMLGIFIPNEILDRMVFIYAGGFIVLIGALLFWVYKHQEKKKKILNKT